MGPFVLRLYIGGDPEQPPDAHDYPRLGVSLRAEDGKALRDDLPAVWTGRPTAVNGDVLVYVNTVADGGGSEGGVVSIFGKRGIATYDLEALRHSMWVMSAPP